MDPNALIKTLERIRTKAPECTALLLEIHRRIELGWNPTPLEFVSAVSNMDTSTDMQAQKYKLLAYFTAMRIHLGSPELVIR